MNKINSIITFIGLLTLYGCGSLNPNYLDSEAPKTINVEGRSLEKRFYLLGDAGVADSDESNEALEAFNALIANEDTSNDHLIFLGDNIL